MCTRTWFVVTVLSCILFWVPSAHPQDDNARIAARALAQEGAGLFGKDDFQGALDKFEQAYAQFPSPKLFFNIGQALRGLSRNVEALEAFERFLAEAKEVSPEFQQQAAAQVSNLRRNLARVTIDCNRPGAVVSVDGKKRGETPLAGPLMVEPGSHTLTLTSEGGQTSGDFTAVAGQELSRVITFEVAQAPVETIPPPPPVLPQLLLPPPLATATDERPKANRRMWYWIAGGTLVAATATTLMVLFGRGDEYPNASLGTRTLP